MYKKIVCLVLCVLIGTSFFGCSEKKASSTEFALNTVITITAYGEKSAEAVNAAFTEIKRIENMLSSHIETSDISKINNGAHLAPVEVSGETAEILRKALEMSEKTYGAFDITVKPLTDLWNITAEDPKVPTDEELKSTLSVVGYENIVINGNLVSFAKEGMKIDLGGAAKGYCADRAADILKSYGIKNAILDLGGNVYALGKNEQGKNWRIGLQDPSKDRGKHFTIEELSDMTAVTSGSYERYFEKNGKIYHHILNPDTGSPADSGLISVTVISDNSFEADMLSTAIFVMGAEEFMKIKDKFEFQKIVTIDKYNTPRTYTK